MHYPNPLEKVAMQVSKPKVTAPENEKGARSTIGHLFIIAILTLITIHKPRNPPDHPMNIAYPSGYRAALPA
ncbi:hypothetical protein SAMN05216327_1102 [Dyadobacter sp. SG02]|nr:hypothetical protein SAMN05216327_1102 [Dyadobacter sp. SG02]